MRREELVKEIEIPSDVTVSYEKRLFTAKGPKGEVSRVLYDPFVSLELSEGKVVVSAKAVGKKEKCIMNTMVAHAANVVKGAATGFSYKLKICSGHFPMNVSVKGDVFEVKNFLGEKVPRTVTIKKGAKVTVNAPEIVVEANDKELAGQVAADIEQLTRITNRDRRIFQDGIYITEKCGKVL